MAISLGQPDFRQRSEESLDVTPLFMKFMLDVGGFVCTALGDAETERPVEDKVFSRHSNLDQNLRYMLLRFTGIEGRDADEYVARLTRTHEAGRSSIQRPYGGEEAVCLALITSPEFLLY
jgi:hypothetical protein